MKRLATIAALIPSLMLTIPNANAQKGDTTLTLSPEEYNVIASMRMVRTMYMDPIPERKLSVMAIRGITDQLDPHTRYISEAETQEIYKIRQPRTGIGIKCRSYNDTLHIVAIDENGPAHMAGLRLGQRLEAIGNNKVSGKILKDSDIDRILENISGSSTTVTILGKKNSTKEIEIDVDSTNNGGIQAHYAPNDSTIYVKISSFNKYSSKVFHNTILLYPRKRRRNIILDLRNNPGGQYSASTDICNEFLMQGFQMSKMEGNSMRDTSVFSNDDGLLTKSRLCVLINENSGSASEIIASCMQDWDRGVIIGRRSYGKGLVQINRKLPTGSSLAVTMARLIAPSGRCVQKQYSKISHEEYMREPSVRKASGENISEEAMLQKAAKARIFQTVRLGRPIHDGVGIIPDVFVAEDTSSVPQYWKSYLENGTIENIVYEYATRHREKLMKRYPTFASYEENLYQTKDIMIEILELLKRRHPECEIPENLIAVWNRNSSTRVMNTQLVAQLAKALYGSNACWRVLNGIDNDFLMALRLINNPQEYRSIIK